MKDEFISMLIGVVCGFVLTLPFYAYLVEPDSVDHGRVQVASGEYECTQIYDQWVCGKVKQ